MTEDVRRLEELLKDADFRLLNAQMIYAEHEIENCEWKYVQQLRRRIRDLFGEDYRQPDYEADKHDYPHGENCRYCNDRLS